MRRSIAEMVFILALGSAVGFGFNAASPKKVPVKGSVAEAQGIQMVTFDELRFYLDQQKGTLVVDARSEEEYSLGHIPGALNVPVDRFEEAFKKDSSALKKASLVVVYCGGGSCNTSHEVADLLQKKGLKKLAVFTEGLPGWMKKSKQGIKTGPQP